MNKKEIKKIGITGQSGFIGSFLKSYIEKNFAAELEVVDFQDSFFSNVKKLQKFVSGCDAIVQLAGMSRGGDAELYKTNIELTNKLIDALEKTGSKPGIIFASSIHEESQSAFGRSKKESRILLEKWAKKRGANFSGLIIPHVFGPNAKPFHNSGLSTFCYQLAHKQEPKIIRDSELKLIYVGHLASKIVGIINKDHWTIKVAIRPDKRAMVSDLLKKLKLFNRSYIEKNIAPKFKNEFDRNLFNTLYSYAYAKNSSTRKEKMLLKVMTIVGTRPEIIRLSRVMYELDRHFEHKIVHTGQNYDYELNEIFFKELEIRKPDFYLGAAVESAAGTIGNIISLSDKLFEQEKPDAVLFYADTNSCLASISAKRRKIPVFHMEAGNRAFDQRIPEDINRKIVDHVSDINMPLTEHARRNLLAEGIKAETIFKTGSPMKEVLNYYMPKIKASKILDNLKLTKGKYFVVSAHREENIDSDENFANFLKSLKAIAKKYKMPIIVSTHPRTRKKLEKMKITQLHKQVRFLKPLGFFEYIKLQLNSFCVVSDSGTITEESSILNFPAIMIRQAHERPEGMDEGTVIMSGLEPKKVLQAIKVVTSQCQKGVRVFHPVADYEVDNVSKKVVRIIMSYTDYINRTVWYKKIQ